MIGLFAFYYVFMHFLTWAILEQNLNVSAVIESQVAEFKDEKEKKEMLKELGMKETTLRKVINAGYNLLNLNTFFTCGPKETRAWTIIRNSSAYDAAGKIHTDFQKGFIKAEIYTVKDLQQYQSEQEIKSAGKIRQEGKEYIVKDGDVFRFLFNI